MGFQPLRRTALRRTARTVCGTLLFPLSVLKQVILGTGIRILMYHRVAPGNHGDQLVVSPEAFGRQMRFLHRRNYRVTTLDEAFRWLQNGGEDSSRPVVITFDDGYQDNYLHAFPVLREYHLPATIFVVTDYIDQGVTPRHDRAPGHGKSFLSWEQIHAMQGSGLITFGSHTCSHHDLPDLSRVLARREITRSREILEDRLGAPVRWFAYPRGAYGTEHETLVAEAGYDAACTVCPGDNRLQDNRMALRRTEVTYKDSLWDFRLKLAGGYDLLHQVWQWYQRQKK